jgi:hypothetical protein
LVDVIDKQPDAQWSARLSPPPEFVGRFTPLTVLTPIVAQTRDPRIARVLGYGFAPKPIGFWRRSRLRLVPPAARKARTGQPW